MQPNLHRTRVNELVREEYGKTITKVKELAKGRLQRQRPQATGGILVLMSSRRGERKLGRI